MLRLRSLRPPSGYRAVALALLGPVVALALGIAIDRTSLVGATSLCLLAVVGASVLGGRRSGLAASVLAFVGLNFFFTPPYHTLTVAHRGDLMALFVFLVVAVVVGTLLSWALEERARAERRVTEARFLDRITSRLGSGETIEKVLGEFARDLVTMFDLATCQIRLAGDHEAIDAGREGGVSEDGPALVVPLSAGTDHGTLFALRDRGSPDFGAPERSFLQSLAGQAALAVERAALDRQVAQARVESEASRTRAALFSAVTHDLKTPLASIKASAGGLLDASATYSEEQRDEMLRTVVEEADRLNRIVVNLLDLARIRAGALEPVREAVWIQDLVNAVLARMHRRLEPFTVRVQIRPELPPVPADPLQMDQVLTNILENAARFSPPGREIGVSAALWQGRVQVRVADQGPGIPQEERVKVFEEFYRKDNGTGRGGSGLGLAIARAIVVSHGGLIWAEGTPSGGAAIVLELPVAEVARRVNPVRKGET